MSLESTSPAGPAPAAARVDFPNSPRAGENPSPMTAFDVSTDEFAVTQAAFPVADRQTYERAGRAAARDGRGREPESSGAPTRADGRRDDGRIDERKG